MKHSDVNELNVLTQAMNTVNEQTFSCDFRGLLSGVAEDSVLVYAAASRCNRIPTIRRNFLASCNKFRTLFVKETATQDYHVTQRHTAEEWKDNQTISS
jgi:hypothetical protein